MQDVTILYALEMGVYRENTEVISIRGSEIPFFSGKIMFTKMFGPPPVANDYSYIYIYMPTG